LTPEELEEAGRFLKSARSDLRALQALVADPAQENDVIGFHAQQAVEKSLKAVIVTLSVEVPYTHDLSFLLDVLVECAVSVPESVAESDWLTPWAVAMRYGAATAASLDRAAALDVARAAVAWANGITEGRSTEAAS
jgi:HEPN domain-containing protein